MPDRLPLLHWLCGHALAVLLLLAGIPRTECCCLERAKSGAASCCCGSGSVEHRNLPPGGCHCDPDDDCGCHHDAGPPSMVPFEPGATDHVVPRPALALASPAKAAVPAPRPLLVGARTAARASPPPLFVVNCVLRR